MNREPIQSSSIKSVGYEPDTLSLEVEFEDGTVYVYSGIPKDVRNEFMAAASKGSFFNSRVKNQYPFQRVS